MDQPIALKDRRFHRILSWEWGPDVLTGSVHREKMEDLLQRSVFDLICLNPCGTQKTLFDDELRRRLAEVIEVAHARGRKVMLDLDLRPAAADFFQENPKEMLGLIEIAQVMPDAEGRANWESSPLQLANHFGTEFPFDHHETRAYTCATDAEGRLIAASLCDITSEYAALSPEEKPQIQVTIRLPEDHLKRSVVVTAHRCFRFPDPFSPAFREFFSKLFDACRELKLDGAALSEWGFPPHPRPEAGHRLHWYSHRMCHAYEERSGRTLANDLIFQEVSGPGSETLAVESPNQYFEMIREVHAGIEEWFYEKAKQTWGPETFIGLHPTWYALTPCHNPVELWRNGLDWWRVKRDFAQTRDKILFPVRTALAHKWGGATYYNLWSGLGDPRVQSYFRETWESARFGGRTHALGYESPSEAGPHLDLESAGVLEQVSALEQRIKFLNYFQLALPDCPILVVMGYPAATHPLAAVMQAGRRDLYLGPGVDSLSLAQKLWQAGFLCDLVPGYELEDGSLSLDRETGRPRYGVQSYRVVILAFPEFSRESILSFTKDCLERGVKLIVLGKMSRDFYGREAGGKFGPIVDRADFFSPDYQGPEKIIEMLKGLGLEPNPIRNGCRLLDGSAIVANAGEVPAGTPLAVELSLDGHQVSARGEDLFGIRLGRAGEVERFFGCMLAELKVDGQEVVKRAEPRHVVAELREDGSYEIIEQRPGEEEKYLTRAGLQEIIIG